MPRQSQYKVVDRGTGKEIKDAFVLLPSKHESHRAALAVVAELSRDVGIARWAWGLLRRIHDDKALLKTVGSTS